MFTDNDSLLFQWVSLDSPDWFTLLGLVHNRTDTRTRYLRSPHSPFALWGPWSGTWNWTDKKEDILLCIQCREGDIWFFDRPSPRRLFSSSHFLTSLTRKNEFLHPIGNFPDKFTDVVVETTMKGWLVEWVFSYSQYPFYNFGIKETYNFNINSFKTLRYSWLWLHKRTRNRFVETLFLIRKSTCYDSSPFLLSRWTRSPMGEDLLFWHLDDFVDWIVLIAQWVVSSESIRVEHHGWSGFDNTVFKTG